MIKMADFLVAIGIILICSLLFARDKLFGEKSSQSIRPSSIVLFLLGLLLTFPISIPCIVIGFLIWKLFLNG